MTLNNQTDDARSQDGNLRTEIRELSEKIDDISIGVSVMAQVLNDYKLQATMRADAGGASLPPDTMFNQAMRDFILGDFDMAIEGFRAFVEMYPGGDQAARAWLHIGDSHASLQRLRDSVDAYTRVINDYPHTQVVPTALFKRANIEVALQEPSNAIADLRDIIERFPTSAEVELARVELQRLQSAAKPKPATKVPTAKPKR
jgi:TolA-binding protein